MSHHLIYTTVYTHIQTWWHTHTRHKLHTAHQTAAFTETLPWSVLSGMYNGQILADNPKFVEWPLGESSPTWQCHRDCQFLFPCQVSDQSLWQFICPSSQSPSTTTTPVLNNSELGLSLKSLQTATHTWGLLPHAVTKPTAFCCTHKNNTRTTGSEWHQHTYNVITQPDNL